MIFNFDTDQQHEAVAALLVYAVYRSRDKRFKVTPDMWGRIERAVESAAKRAEDLGEFLQRLKPKLSCPAINPKWAKVPGDLMTMKALPDGTLAQVEDAGRRQFLTGVLREADAFRVLECLRRKAALVVLLVRDRLERERPFVKEEDDDSDDGNEDS